MAKTLEQILTEKLAQKELEIARLVTRNQELKGAGELMAYFEKVGERNSAAKVDGTLGTPSTTLDQWLAMRKASLSKTDA